MKRIILLVAFFLLATSTLFAQKRKYKEKIRAYKIAYLTEQLDLTEKEAEKFWSMYNTYDKRIQEIRHKEKHAFLRHIKESGGVENLTDDEAEKIVKKMIALEAEEERITNKFYKKIQNILSYKKILKLEIAEHSFRRKLLRKYRDKRRKQKTVQN